MSLRSFLRGKIARYLAVKKALGRRFATETAVLGHLDRFLADQRWSSLTPAAFNAWTLAFADLSPSGRRKKMHIVRNLCLYIRREDPDFFVPDPLGFPRPHAPRPPYIFSEEQIVRLLRAATLLPSSSTSLFRAEVIRIGIVLLYTAGLRRGELVRLAMSDFDADERTLLVRASKFHKSRLIALSRSAAAEMERYLRTRRRLPHGEEAPLLVNNHGGSLGYSTGGFAHAMRQLFRATGVRTPAGRLPRVHDLRHTFAVHALLRWYRDGVDVQAKLPALAIAMGHVSVASTAYYLSFIEPVATAASARFARHCRDIISGRGQAR